ncbi:MAG: hypothetical protein V1886_00405 [archaeon]
MEEAEMAGVLDTILELQKRGMGDAEIVSQLRNMNYSAQEITDAINQIKVKSAVNEGENGAEEMHPSIMQEDEELEVPMPSKKKKPKQLVVDKSQQSYPAYPQYSAPVSYSSEEQQHPAAQPDIEMIEEIAEEIVSEKFSEIRDKISSILDFKDNIEIRINNINDRLKRIEASNDATQAAILGKIQQYGQDIKSLGTEMQVLGGAFGKILNPLVDNVKELGKITDKFKPAGSMKKQARE